MDLGELIKARRQAAALTQGDLARLVRMSRGAINNIESGDTKTISPAVASALTKVLPLTMAELLRAMGWEIPERVTKLPPGMLEDLEAADPVILDAVRALLLGHQSLRQEAERRGRQ